MPPFINTHFEKTKRQGQLIESVRSRGRLEDFPIQSAKSLAPSSQKRKIGRPTRRAPCRRTQTPSPLGPTIRLTIRCAPQPSTHRQYERKTNQACLRLLICYPPIANQNWNFPRNLVACSANEGPAHTILLGRTVSYLVLF